MTGKKYRQTISKLVLVSALGIALVVGQKVKAAEFPEPSEAVFVYDETNELSTATKNYIIEINQEYEKTSEKPQLAVALVNSLGELTVDEYAVGLFNKWQIGDKELSNGALLLLAPTEGKVRIEVGYGLEDVLTDALTGWMLDDNLEALKAQQFDQGVFQIVTEMALKINEELGIESQVVKSQNRDYEQLIADQKAATTEEEEVSQGNSKLSISPVVFRFLGIIIFLWLSRKLGSSGSGGSSSGGGFGGFGGGSSGGSTGSGSSFGGGSSGGGGSSRSF
ncbi:TPM domain-containing protein [Vagococcus salmoninarum]|uniref:TPM domain-containing protein n=1 Tax=Vagococcus salmoninarum TaxID=2739 RepID=UPI003F9B2918